MADPYATRAPDLSGRPAGQPPWIDAVAKRGGATLGPEAEADETAAFAVVACRGIGTMAPVARLSPALAALLWLEHGSATRSAASANRLFERLGEIEAPILSIKHGAVGGPRGRPGCTEVGTPLIESVLEPYLAGAVGWERDPDFGYEVPSRVPGLEEGAARVLLPRLLYADHDRAYEHAGLVAAKQRERSAIAASLPSLRPEIAEAARWPPRTGPGGEAE